MLDRFVHREFFIYLTLTAEEMERLLVPGPRVYRQIDSSKVISAKCIGHELDHDQAIDLLIAAEDMADHNLSAVHLQTPTGFTVDIIYPTVRI